MKLHIFNSINLLLSLLNTLPRNMTTENSPEYIQQEIERHTKSIKKIKNATPLVIVVVCSWIYISKLYKGQPLNTNSYIMAGAIILYCSCFVYAYLKHRNEIKRLTKSLR